MGSGFSVLGASQLVQDLAVHAYSSRAYTVYKASDVGAQGSGCAAQRLRNPLINESRNTPSIMWDSYCDLRHVPEIGVLQSLGVPLQSLASSNQMATCSLGHLELSIQRADAEPPPVNTQS